MTFKHGDIVYWISPRHKIGFSPDKKGNPREFVVITPGYKYCILRSRDDYKKGFSYKDLHHFDMKNLVLVEEEKKAQ